MTKTEILAIAKSINFKQWEVSATLENRKTVMRRVIKYSCPSKPESTLDDFIGKSDPQLLIGCAPYKTGDYLYVRETWCWCPCWDCGMNVEHECHDETGDKFYSSDKSEWGCYGYKCGFGCEPFDKWQSPVLMPKEAARLLLRVTDVRVERLQSIDVSACVREGVTWHEYPCAWTVKAKPAFVDLWDSTIKKSALPLYGWNANPWVWVIKFERVKVENEH